jgi:hypothetical protein
MVTKGMLISFSFGYKSESISVQNFTIPAQSKFSFQLDDFTPMASSYSATSPVLTITDPGNITVHQ